MRADSEAWPLLIRPLVAKYGPLAVWQAGFETVGFPANWITHGGEKVLLETFLFRQSKGA